jgi:hypothetical protein
MNERPAFREGTYVIDSVRLPNLPRPIRNKIDELEKRPGYEMISPKSRLYGIKSKDQLSQQLIEQQGITVSLSDKTLTDLYGTKRPRTRTITGADGKTTTIFVRDRFGNVIMDDATINETMLNGYKSNYDTALTTILKEIKDGSLKSETDMNTIKDFLQLAIIQDTLTIQQLKKIYSIVSIIDGFYEMPDVGIKPIPDVEEDKDGKKILSTALTVLREGVVTADDMKTPASGRNIVSDIYLYLISNAVANGLTIDKPVVGTGNKPILLSSVDRAVRGGEVLDLKTARMFPSIDELALFVGTMSDDVSTTRELRQTVIYATRIKIDDLKGAKRPARAVEKWTNEIMGEYGIDPAVRELVVNTIRSVLSTHASFGTMPKPVKNLSAFVEESVNKDKDRLSGMFATADDEKKLESKKTAYANELTTKITKVPGFDIADRPQIMMSIEKYVNATEAEFYKELVDTLVMALDTWVSADDIKAIIDGKVTKPDVVRDIINAPVEDVLNVVGWKHGMSNRLKNIIAREAGNYLDARELRGSGLRVYMKGSGIHTRRSAAHQAKAEMEKYARVKTQYFNRGGTTIIR